MATQIQTDQQQRVITQTKTQVEQLVNLLGELRQRADSYNRLGLSDDGSLSDDALELAGTTKAAYRSAITSIGALQDLLTAGHGTNLESFAR